MRETQMFIDGTWVDGHSYFTSVSPTTQQPFARVAEGGEAAVVAAVSAARAALPEWRTLSAESRAAIVRKAADILADRYGEPGQPTPLKQLLCDEMGKRLPEADIEVIESSDMLRYYADNGPVFLRPRGLQLNTTLWPTKESTLFFEPIGIVGVIKPWNYPLEMPIWALGPALVTGNTVVFKPSEHSSLVGLEVARIFVEAGLPAGVLNVITGGSATGQALVRHSGVDMISFTGSVAAGREVAVECARGLRRYSLELSGNDAAIVLPDAHLDLAANGLIWGAFCNSGQVCVGIKRCFVHESIYSELVEKVVERTRALRVGIDYGPLVSRAQLLTVKRQVADAIGRGAIAVVGGDIQAASAQHFEPTVLTNVSASAELMSKECFGPVLPMIPFSSVEEVIELANESAYGLGASVWTQNRELASHIASRLEVGTVWINDVNVAFAEAPWGGRKSSGHGVDLSDWSMYEYVNLKHVSFEASDAERRAWWYPY